MPATVLILPGIGNSGPEHWQSMWEQAHPEFTRVQQRDWDNPDCTDWVAAIEQAVKEAGSFTSAIAVTSMPAAASARGTMDMNCLAVGIETCRLFSEAATAEKSGLKSKPI